MQENKPVLIAGLGNPGPEYAATRHNAGFMAVDRLAGFGSAWKKEKNALVCASADDNGRKIIFVKPQTYMNDSGAPVRALMDFYKIPIENLIVIHDDMDIKVGAVREKLGGGSAGHNGIKSIDAHVGREYLRIRIGIGHPRDIESPVDPSDWVLGRFSAAEAKAVLGVIDGIEV